VYATDFPGGLLEKQRSYNKNRCDEINSLSISDTTACWGVIKVR
jgi:hypothetical protein